MATTASPKSRKSAAAAAKGQTAESKRPAAAKSAGGPKAKAAAARGRPAAPQAAKKAAVTRAPKPAGRSAGGKAAAAKRGAASRPAVATKKLPAAKQAPAAQKTAAPKKAKSTLPTDPVERLRLEVRRALEELKARDITEIDVRGKTSIADYLVIASGTSNRHVKSIADEVVKYAKKAGSMPLGVEGQREAEWVLVDLGDLVVHVMLPRVREFYGLERLWTVGAEQIEALRA